MAPSRTWALRWPPSWAMTWWSSLMTTTLSLTRTFFSTRSTAWVRSTARASTSAPRAATLWTRPAPRCRIRARPGRSATGQRRASSPRSWSACSRPRASRGQTTCAEAAARFTRRPLPACRLTPTSRAEKILTTSLTCAPLALTSGLTTPGASAASRPRRPPAAPRSSCRTPIAGSTSTASSRRSTRGETCAP